MGRSCFVCRIREGFEGQIPVECRDLAFLLLDERYLEKRRREDEEKRERRQEKALTRILATVVDRDRDRTRQTGDLRDEKRQGPRRQDMTGNMRK